MAKKSTGRPVGRPKGTRTAAVELETLSFKIPPAFKAQLQAYAKQCRQSTSELIREGIEWRIGEGDSGNIKGVEVGVEFLHGMLSALVEEVRQLRGAVQALEQRLGEPGSVHAPSVTGNTDLVSVDGDIPAASMKAQMAGAGSVQASSVTGNTDIPSASIVPRVKSDKAEVIARLQQMHDTGLDSTQIAAALQAEGVPTLSGKGQWHAGTVRKLLAK